MNGYTSVPYCFNWCTFEIYFGIRKCDTSSFVVLSKDYFGSLKKIFFCHWDFDRHCIESVIALGSVGILTILTLIVQEHGILFTFICVSLIFHQCFVIFSVQIFHLNKIYSYFIPFDAIVSGFLFQISFFR